MTHDIQIGDWVTYRTAESEEPRRSRVIGGIDEGSILLLDGRWLSRRGPHGEQLEFQVERYSGRESGINWCREYNVSPEGDVYHVQSRP